MAEGEVIDNLKKVNESLIRVVSMLESGEAEKRGGETSNSTKPGPSSSTSSIFAVTNACSVMQLYARTVE